MCTGSSTGGARERGGAAPCSWTRSVNCVPDLQVMLLRVLQEGEVERLGGGTSRRVDVRLIAATNRDLEAAVQEGRFLEDLFYRLNVFPVHLPALRERREDIPLLAEYFLQRAAPRVGRRFSRVERASMRRLQQYPWPGSAALAADGCSRVTWRKQ